MICPKCSYTLTLLFTSTACDRCNGLLKPEAVTDDYFDYFMIGNRVRYKNGPSFGTVTNISQAPDGINLEVRWDDLPMPGMWYAPSSLIKE